MAKPNFSYEKRQRELAKKKKKEEKRQQKLKAKEEGAQVSQPNATDDWPFGFFWRQVLIESAQNSASAPLWGNSVLWNRGWEKV